MPTTLDFDGLQKLLWTFAGHRVLTVAGRTGVLRRLAEAPATTDEVARDLDLDPLATGKVIRALTALGVTVAEGDSYRVTDALTACFSVGDDDLLPFLEHSHRMYDGWGANLEPWLRGQGWPSTAASPDHAHGFGRAMRSMGSHTARQVAAALDLSGVTRVLDVGGGFGHFSRELVAREPGLHATVLDTPTVADLGRQELAGTPFAGRIGFVGGDYLTSDYGSGYDLVLFASVLHQEMAADAAEMVRRGAAALAPGGRVVVVDFAIDESQREHLLGCLFAINMRSFGDTYSAPTIRSWMEAAGLAEVERTDLTDYRWMIVGRR